MVCNVSCSSINFFQTRTTLLLYTLNSSLLTCRIDFISMICFHISFSLKPCFYSLLDGYINTCYVFGLFNHFSKTVVLNLAYLWKSILSKVCNTLSSSPCAYAQQISLSVWSCQFVFDFSFLLHIILCGDIYLLCWKSKITKDGKTFWKKIAGEGKFWFWKKFILPRGKKWSENFGRKWNK